MISVVTYGGMLRRSIWEGIPDKKELLFGFRAEQTNHENSDVSNFEVRMKMKFKLGELTKIRTGKLDANASSADGQYPFFTCSRVTLKIASYSYDCECILVAGNGDLNVKYYNGKFDAYQRTYIIEDNSNERLYMPYLYYFMERYMEELRKQAIGGVIKYIKLGNLTNIQIELPGIEIQKEVVNVLTKANKIIDDIVGQRDTLDVLIKSRLRFDDF